MDTNPDTGEKHVDTVLVHDELAPGTLNSIAKQGGANDVQTFRE